MGNTEEAKPSNSDKSSSHLSPVDQGNVHVYPHWAAMQAFYGQTVGIPPYYNSAVASGHPPPPPPPPLLPYMWGPQPMKLPCAAPYAALYSQAGVYAHPAVPMAGTPLSIDTPTKTTGNTDNGLMKKLKEFDGLAMSIGNGCAEGPTVHNHSLSSETEGSTEGITSGTDGPKIKRRREVSTTKDGKHMSQSSPLSSVSRDGNPVPESVLQASVSVKSNHHPSQSSDMVPCEPWLLSERDLKRERRKQSNRESARRSRIRKQAETQELSLKVETLTAETMALRSEINQLTEKSEKLKMENATLMEKLKGSKAGPNAEEVGSDNRSCGVNT